MEVTRIAFNRVFFIRNGRIKALLVYVHSMYILIVYFYVSYFCLVDVRLKQDTLRLIPVETILKDFENASLRLHPLFHKPRECH